MHLVIGTAGHIDHGKSTLVRALTGIDPDRLKEEKARGITIDLGFAHCQVGALRLAFVDVPGHERFVRNMLAGATGVDAVLLVVAADESVMPQTREHFAICRLLGVRAGVVALTKSDAADPDLLEIAGMDVRELVAGSFLDGAAIVPVSARTGEGLDALQQALAALAPRAAVREHEGATRLPIDRAFTMRGFGAVVTGTLQAGAMHVEEELTLLPAGRRVRVRGLQVHGEKVTQAAGGQRVAVNVSDVDASMIVRGDTLVTPGAFEPTTRLDVTLELLPDARPLAHGTRVRVHLGTSEVLGRVAVAQVTSIAAARTDAAAAATTVPATPWPATPLPATPLPTTTVPPGGRARARLRLEGSIVATRGDRFVLRAYSPVVTIGGGVVLDPQPARSALRTAAGLARFAALDPDAHEWVSGESESLALRGGRSQRDGSDAPAPAGGAEGERRVLAMAGASDLRAALVMLEEAGRGGLPTTAFGTRLGLRGAAIEAMAQRLTGGGHAVRVGDLLVSSAIVDRLAEALVAQVRRHHQAQPDSEGLPREEARDRLGVAPRTFDALVDRLTTAGALGGRDRLALPTHRAAVPDTDAAALARVETLLRDAGLKPPDTVDLAKQAGLASPVLDRLINFLVRQKRVVRLGALAFHQEALARMKDETRALKAASANARATVDVASFKTRYDMSRKYAIPLLEYLDRERVTRRVGDDRVVL